MSNKFKKGMSLLLTAVMAGALLAGCGGGDDEQQQVTSNDPNKPYAGTKLKYAVSSSATEGGETVDLVNFVKEKTGIEIEFTIVPNTNAGELDKTLVSLTAGDEMDIVYGTGAKLKDYYKAKVLTPLDELAQNAGYDIQATFGDNSASFDGQVYGLPAFKDVWVTFYNKDMFDAANVAYPTAEGWTWEKYIETAKQLTQGDKFGSFMLDYDNYNYMYAMQNGAEAYKEGQTETNFDDPRFAEGVKWFYSLGNDLKIQPDAVTYASKVYPWNSFVAQDKFGMFVCGSWVSSMLPNKEQYPREWKCGVAPMPYPEGQEPSTLYTVGCYAIPSTSKNKEAAFEAVKCMAEYQYTLGYGRIPARVDLTDEEITQYIEEKFAPTYADDGWTVEEIKTAMFNDNQKMIPEKIIGPADTTISKIIIEETQLYAAGSKSLEDTMSSIKTRSDEAIKEEAETE